MVPYALRKFLFQVISKIPTPKWIIKFFQYYVRTKSGENFGDIKLNGEFLFIKEHAPSCDIIFDVGANTGS